MEILEYARGDDYPLEVQLTRNGDWTLVGSTVEMSFTFSDEIVHTFTGVVTDYDNMLVEFEPTVDAVAQIRVGKYDVQVDDGVYKATHMRGRINVVWDVTP